jgi:hypothetical protein
VVGSRVCSDTRVELFRLNLGQAAGANTFDVRAQRRDLADQLGELVTGQRQQQTGCPRADRGGPRDRYALAHRATVAYTARGTS